MGNVDEADLKKAYARAQGKDDDMVTIASRSQQIRRKPHLRKKTDNPKDLNIAPDEELFIASGLTQEAAEDEDISLLDGASIALDPS